MFHTQICANAQTLQVMEGCECCKWKIPIVFLRIKIVNISLATRDLQISTACSATARFICWGGSAGETSPIWKAASRTAASAWYPTAGRTMDLLPTVSRRLLARWRNGRRRKDSKRRFQPIHSEMHMEKAPNCYAQAGAFLDIGSRSFNKVAGRHPVSEGCCPPYC